MILKNGEEASFKFPNKRAMKNFNQMNVEVLDKFLCKVMKTGVLKKIGGFSKRKIWKN